MYQDRAKPNPRGRGCSWNGTQEYTDGVLVLALHLTAARLFVPLPVCQSEPQQLLARAGGMERNGTEPPVRLHPRLSFTPRVLFAAAVICTNINVESVPNQAQEY